MKIDYIVIHCSATKRGQNVDAERIRRWHVDDNGWSDIGYHYVVERDGSLVKGRSDDVPGAHVKGFNDRSLGICLVGGINDSDEPEFNYTAGQMVTMIGLVKQLTLIHPEAKVVGHNELDAGKDCPCFNVEALGL